MKLAAFHAPRSIRSTVLALFLGFAGSISAADATSGTPKKDPKSHWAFQAPVQPPVPKVKQQPPPAHPIDAFVWAKLESEGLTPSPEADKTTLLRRLSLDLIGLPPTLEEADAFLTDTSPDAYEKQVDRLLQSPHFGERWARLWLDAARYADSDGFEKDKPRFIWHYRDWVIRAMNRNLPYDQFVIEQIAGDLLPSPTQDQWVATGFLRNSMLNEEGGVDPEQFRMDAMFDRMDCLGKSVLGLTVQCAQCHNHKFDPFTQDEYYRMFAFINNDHESSMVAYTPTQEQQRADLLRQMRDLEEGLRRSRPNWAEEMSQWEDRVQTNQPLWSVVSCVNAGDNGERYYYYSDGSIRASSYAPTQWTAHFRGTNPIPTIGAFRFEQLTDPNLPCHGPGRSIRGMSALSEFKVEAVEIDHPTNKTTFHFVAATADFANAEKPLESEFDDLSGKKRVYGPVAFAVDGKDDTAWGIDAGPGRRNQARKAVFVADKPVTFSSPVALNVYLEQNHGGWNSDDNQNHNLGRFRISVTADTNVVADPIPDAIREIFKTDKAQRSAAQTAAVFSYWRTTVPDFKSANDQIEQLWQRWPEGAPTLVTQARKSEGPGEEKRPTFSLKRGDWLKPEKEVEPGVPAFLHPYPANTPISRLGFARWLVDRKSPTTARVLINRLWQTYFGTGIVETSEDFGTQSPAPSHRELLDWLACEFMNRGWDTKAMHRLIVTSATYRQSSHVTSELYARDPYNRLLARGPRQRIDAELVRDHALAASGLLNPEVGGPSVYAPAPDFLFKPPASYGPKTWTEAKGPERFRRALYTFRFRSVPYPMLQTFDAPNGDFSCVRRAKSNTPLQALTMLNEPLFMESAQALALKTLQEGGVTDDSRITYAFRRVLTRPPTDSERSELKSLLRRQKDHIAEGWVNASELATGKTEIPTHLPEGTTPTQWAAYTVVSRVLLNLDEAVTKE